MISAENVNGFPDDVRTSRALSSPSQKPSRLLSKEMELYDDDDGHQDHHQHEQFWLISNNLPANIP